MPAMPASRKRRAESASPGRSAGADAGSLRASAGDGAGAGADAAPASRTRGQRLAGSAYALYLLAVWAHVANLPPLPALPLAPAHLYADSHYWSAPGSAVPAPAAAPAPVAASAPGASPSDGSESDASEGTRAARRAGRLAVRRALIKRAKLESARQQQLQEHILPRRTPCQAGPDGRGCGALVWEGEKDMCCRKGATILSEEHNPPLSAEYLTMLQQPSVPHNSRMLNTSLAFGATGTLPAKEIGGQGLHTERGGLSFFLTR